MLRRHLVFISLAAFLALAGTPAQALQTQPKDDDLRRKNFGKSLKELGKPGPDAKANDVERMRAEADPDVIRIDTELVVTEVLVTDRKGDLVVGLDRKDFLIEEDDVAHDIELFAPAANNSLPKSIVLILDNNADEKAHRETLAAARSLIDWLGPKDRLAIVADNIRLLTDFTSDKKLLHRSLNGLQYRKGNSWWEYSSLLAVLNELFRPGELRPTILLQTEGSETLMLRPIWSGQQRACQRGLKNACERPYGLPDIIAAVERSRATVYGIIPQPRIVGLPRDEQLKRTHNLLNIFSSEYHDRTDEKERAKFRKTWEDLTLLETETMQRSLMDVSRVSGGFTTFLESAVKPSEIYSSIFKTIDNRYTIGYYSNSKKPGTLKRSVSITLRNLPEYKVLARTTYTPMKAQ